MDSKEIINFCIEKGILIDKELLNIFEDANDINSVKIILEKILEQTSQKIITKKIFSQNREHVYKVFSSLPNEQKNNLDKLRINLGLSIEISRESHQPKILDEQAVSENELRNVKVLSSSLPPTKKLEVKDFSKHFSQRYVDLRKILQEHPGLSNLISINKLSKANQEFSIIGIIYNKTTTKNNNLIFEVEDLTGRMKVIATQKNKEVYQNAENLPLDSVVAFKGSGNSEILFVDEVILPDAFLLERKKSLNDEWALFISDVHVGSRNFMEENFLKFIDYLNGNIPGTPEAKKIKYLFIVGDLVAGVGVYPNQEKELAIKDIEGQYTKMAELLSKIRRDIRIIIIHGNHDCVRLMEPQPILDEKYAWALYNLENVTLVPNPSLVNIGSTETFEGFNVLMYHGFSYFYYVHNIPSLIEGEASKSPDKVMAYLLKNRHIAPTHASNQYLPSEQDGLMIRIVPDIFVSGHTHKNSISYYNNILIISNACWEELMPYQEKMGFESDYCKVPMFNLKTRETKILDFLGEKKKSNPEEILNEN